MILSNGKTCKDMRLMLILETDKVRILNWGDVEKR